MPRPLLAAALLAALLAASAASAQSPPNPMTPGYVIGRMMALNAMGEKCNIPDPPADKVQAYGNAMMSMMEKSGMTQEQIGALATDMPSRLPPNLDCASVTPRAPAMMDELTAMAATVP